MKKLAQVKIGEQFWLKEKLGIGQVKEFETLGGLITAILPNIYILAGLILFFFLIGGGLMFIVSAGQENPEGAAKGKKAITAAVAGFIIIFASYWIMEIIRVVTGLDILGGGGL